MNACDESVAAATERIRAARPSAPLAAEVPQQPLTEGSSLEGSSLDYWLLSRLRSLMGNPPVEFAVRSGARVGPGVANPVARRALLESILYITRNPERTVLLSSHLLDDIERVADHLLILDRSVLRASCSMDKFRNSITHYQLTFPGVPPALPANNSNKYNILDGEEHYHAHVTRLAKWAAVLCGIGAGFLDRIQEDAKPNSFRREFFTSERHRSLHNCGGGQRP